MWGWEKPEGAEVAGLPAFEGFWGLLVAGVGGEVVLDSPAAEAGAVGLELEAAMAFGSAGAVGGRRLGGEESFEPIGLQGRPTCRLSGFRRRSGCVPAEPYPPLKHLKEWRLGHCGGNRKDEVPNTFLILTAQHTLVLIAPRHSFHFNLSVADAQGQLRGVPGKAAIPEAL